MEHTSSILLQTDGVHGLFVSGPTDWIHLGFANCKPSNHVGPVVQVAIIQQVIFIVVKFSEL